MRFMYLPLAILLSLIATMTPRLGAADIQQKRPLNVIVILVDDLGWIDLSCQGSTYYETPKIDRLASQGMRFTNAYAACAVCSPTRTALLTGKYPARLGTTDWFRMSFQPEEPIDKNLPAGYVGGTNLKLITPRNPRHLDLSEVTLAEMLQKAGYATMQIGKWHLGGPKWYPQTQGFDASVGGCDLGLPPSYFDPYQNKRWGKQGIPTLKARKPGEYLTDRESDEAVRFIEAHRDKPFFLYMSHYAVHAPIEGKKSVAARYAAKSGKRQGTPAYAAMVQSVDEATGRLTDALDRLGIADRTLVIFTSDNGGERRYTDNAPLRAGKGFAYEGGIRVPLIVRWPNKIPAGTVSHQPAISIDILPTVLEAANVPLSDDRQIDGISLLGHLQSAGKKPPAQRSLYWHFPHYRRGGPTPYSIVRSGDWKLIQRWEGPQFELYDLKQDPREQKNLAAQMPKKVASLRTDLAAHLKAVGARLPRKNPAFQAETSP